MLNIQRTMCSTCIYRRRGAECRRNVQQLEAEIADGYGGFTTYRACHHTDGGVVCAGFWARHKDRFQRGQLAQRLGYVRKVFVDLYNTL